jgi:regulator of sigma E protease
MGSSVLLPIVGEIRTGSPAEKAGLRPEDKILSVDMQATHSWDELAKLIANTTKATLPLQIKRNGEIFTIIVEPQIQVTKDIFGESFSRSMIGVSCAGKIEKHKPTLWQLPKIGLVETGRLLEGKIKDLISTFADPHKKEVIAGPARTMESATNGQSFFVFILYYIASSTVSIALISLLPLPIFDGGQFVYLIVESARRKQISLDIKMRLRLLTILVFAALFVYAVAFEMMYLL